MLPKDSLDHIKAKITIENATNTRKFTFETKILSFETSKDEAVKMGQFMRLQDSQIKPFKQGIGNGKTLLFHYSVEIQADPEFLIEMNRRACVKEAVPNPIAAATDDNIQEANNGIVEGQSNDGQRQVQSQKQKKKEEDEEAKRNSLFGQQTSSGETQENSNHGMPVNKNSPNKCPVPGCNASNEPMNKKDTAEAHKFVLNCPKLHGMNRKDCWDFYKESKCKCKKCFSTEHNWNSCPLVKIFPKFCKEKKKDGTNCGGEHHELLHWEPKGERSNRNQNTETYGSDSEEQSQE